jgi:hypothetical protein
MIGVYVWRDGTMPDLSRIPDVLLDLMKKERKKAQSVAGRRQADYPPEVPTAMNWNAVFTDPFESAESQ